jgi:regulatory protein
MAQGDESAVGRPTGDRMGDRRAAPAADRAMTGAAERPTDRPVDRTGDRTPDHWYGVALELLGRREHAPVELARKLTVRGASEDDVAAAIARLVEAGDLSERRFAEEWVRRHGDRRGVERLKNELATRSVSPESIAVAVADLAQRQQALAEAARAKRFGELPCDLRERARQWRFLLGRGFSADVVRRVLGGDAGADD